MQAQNAQMRMSIQKRGELKMKKELCILGLGDKTFNEVMIETVDIELKEGRTLEQIINYHDKWNWEKFLNEGEF